MSNIIPIKFQYLIRYKETWQILICCDCHTAVPMKSLTRHLHEAHFMKAKDYQPLLNAIYNLTACHTTKEYPHPLNHSIPIDNLLVYPGYQCEHCDDLLTKSETIAQRHIY